MLIAKLLPNHIIILVLHWSFFLFKQISAFINSFRTIYHFLSCETMQQIFREFSPLLPPPPACNVID